MNQVRCSVDYAKKRDVDTNVNKNKFISFESTTFYHWWIFYLSFLTCLDSIIYFKYVEITMFVNEALYGGLNLPDIRKAFVEKN